MDTMERQYIPRFLETGIASSLQNWRVTTIMGPRQSGKTTLVKKFVSEKRQFFSLDDNQTYEAAKTDPVGFIKNIDCGIIDEVQRVPDLIRAIKLSVDNDTRPGRFILTGSADILTIPTISESLAGRMSINRLYPLSQAEIAGNRISLIDTLFVDGVVSLKHAHYETDDLIKRVLRGGYPEMQHSPSEASMQDWAENYVEGVLSRDIQDINNAYKFNDLARLLQASVLQSGTLVVYSDMAKHMQLDAKTVKRYMDTLEQMYLLRFLPAWHQNGLKRLVKSPKIHFLDTGLISAIRQFNLQTFETDRTKFGPLLESFVFGEILKQRSWSQTRVLLYHFRDKEKHEVDLVIVNRNEEVVGIEVKASATVRSSDFAGLRILMNAAGSSFRHGIILYAGSQVIPHGERLSAIPIPALWT